MQMTQIISQSLSLQARHLVHAAAATVAGVAAVAAAACMTVLPPAPATKWCPLSIMTSRLAAALGLGLVLVLGGMASRRAQALAALVGTAATLVAARTMATSRWTTAQLQVRAGCVNAGGAGSRAAPRGTSCWVMQPLCHVACGLWIPPAPRRISFCMQGPTRFQTLPLRPATAVRLLLAMAAVHLAPTLAPAMLMAATARRRRRRQCSSRRLHSRAMAATHPLLSSRPPTMASSSSRRGMPVGTSWTQ